MDNTLRDELDRLAGKAQAKADLARKNSEKFKAASSHQAECREYGKAEEFRRHSASYLNDYFYWKGQAVALHGVAAGLGLREVVERLREVVEEELDDTPSCP